MSADTPTPAAGGHPDSPIDLPDDIAAIASPVEQLRQVMRRLRDPDGGCEWDLEQTFDTIAPYTLEEAYEVVDAIERGDLDDLCDELGDLLLQVVFHAQMAEEENAFTFDDCARAIVEKMVRRHPHVFGDQRFTSTDALKQSWEAEKARERARKRGTTDADAAASALDGIARSLPALSLAGKLQTRAARVGFDWPDIDPVYEKVGEEIEELLEATDRDDPDAIEDELGDLLFAVVNLSRHLDVDAEQALRRASGKFERRFRRVEQLAEGDARLLKEMHIDELDELWEMAKDEESTRAGEDDLDDTDALDDTSDLDNTSDLDDTDDFDESGAFDKRADVDQSGSFDESGAFDESADIDENHGFDDTGDFDATGDFAEEEDDADATGAFDDDDDARG